MSRIIIEPKDPEEEKLIQELLNRMNIKSKYLTDEELEENIIAYETLKGSKTSRVSEQTIMEYLKKNEG